MTYSITRRIEFDAGHRVYGHEGKCASVHGHRYVVLITCKEKVGLDGVGRVIDFSVIKDEIGGWIDKYLDHGMLLCSEDPLVDIWKKELVGHKLYIMEFNPTAENIARLIYEVSVDMLGVFTQIEVDNVVVHETPNCSATFPK